MKKLKLLFLVLIFFSNLAFSTKVATFPELKRPFLIHADDNQLYISDGPNIFIYSLIDYRLIKQFGRSGEGPGEFKINPNRSGGSVVIFLTSDNIVVNSVGKVSFFSKDGQYLSEIPTGGRGSRFQLLGEQFVGEKGAADKNTSYLTMNIYDFHFEKKKEIYRQKGFYQPQGDLNPFYLIGPITYVYDNKIFIIAEMMEISVFDEKGEKLYSIKPEYEKILITGDYKEKFHNWFKNYLPLREFYKSLKDRLKFPKYLPQIRFFHVVDNKIYILTYKKMEGKSEFLIYDIKGNFQGSIMFPLVESDEFGFLFYPYTIKNGKLYQLIEDEKKWTWELHVTEIK